MNTYNGTTYHEDTPLGAVHTLETARIARDFGRGYRVRLVLGDTETGKSWLDEYDVSGYVGRSTGRVKVPLLIHNTRSRGGGAILDHCILRIIETRTHVVLYEHPLYQSPDLFVVLNEGNIETPDFPWEVWLDSLKGTTLGRFQTENEAQRFVDFHQCRRMVR